MNPNRLLTNISRSVLKSALSVVLSTLIAMPAFAKSSPTTGPNPNESYLLQTPDKAFGVSQMTTANTSVRFQNTFKKATALDFKYLKDNWGGNLNYRETIFLVQTDEYYSVQVVQFLLALKKHKPVLMRHYELRSDTYNKLATMAYAIYGVESKFGTHWKYSFKENNQGLVSSLKSTLLGQSKNATNSRGLTQIKDIPDSIEKLYPTITPNTLRQPEAAAVTTIGFLVETLKMLRSLRDNQASHGVKPGDVNLSYMTNVNIFDYIPYVYSGRMAYIFNGPYGANGATVKDNLYIQEMKRHMKSFFIMEKEL